jgi:hypothetical protein
VGISGIRPNRDSLSATPFNLLDDRRGRIGAFRVGDGYVRSVRRQAIAAPMPREPPVTSATLLVKSDIGSPLVSDVLFCEQIRHLGSTSYSQKGNAYRSVPTPSIITGSFQTASSFCASDVKSPLLRQGGTSCTIVQEPFFSSSAARSPTLGVSGKSAV